MKFDSSIRDYSLIKWEPNKCGWNLQSLIGDTVKYYGNGTGVWSSSSREMWHFIISVASLAGD